MSSAASGNEEPTAPGGTEPTADRSTAPATEGSAQSTAAGERETTAVGGTEPTAAEREATAAASADRMPEDETDQKRSGRRPEGPAHARKGSALQTIKRTLSEFSEDNLTDSAAALTYYAILSIFPALLALVAIVGLVGDPRTVTKEMTTLVTSIGPASAAQTFKAPIEGLTKSSGTAGILLIVGIASALWTASGYVGAFMRASNVIMRSRRAARSSSCARCRCWSRSCSSSCSRWCWSRWC
jgi:membrane protein